MVPDFKAVHIRDPAAQVGYIAIHVKNPLAVLAYEVVMPVAVVIIVCGAIDVANIDELLRFRHLAEIPVNCSLAY